MRPHHLYRGLYADEHKTQGAWRYPTDPVWPMLESNSDASRMDPSSCVARMQPKVAREGRNPRPSIHRGYGTAGILPSLFKANGCSLHERGLRGEENKKRDPIRTGDYSGKDKCI